MEAIKSKLSAKDFSFVTVRDIPGQDGQRSVYFLAKAVNGSSFYIELKLKAGVNACKITVKSTNKPISEILKVAIVKTLM